MTRPELVDFLLGIRGAKALAFRATTPVEVKKGCPYRDVWKTAVVNGMVNFWYDRGVYRRLATEGKSPDTFKRGTSWHVPVLVGDRLTPLCRSKNAENEELYLRVMFISSSKVQYHSNGNEIDESVLLPWRRASSGYLNQGLDCPLVFLTYKLRHVEVLSVDGRVQVMSGT